MNNIDPEKLLELLDETEKALEHLLAGLRVSEVAALRWRAVNLARATIEVESGKTDAASRVVDMSPSLRDEVASHKARSRRTDPDELVFPARNGTVQHRANISNRALAPAIRRANERLVMEGRPPIQEGVTNHTLRRTFCTLLFEAGASPAYAMQQMGHESAQLSLEVYSKVMQRTRDTGEKVDALIRGADWAQAGTNGSNPEILSPSLETKTPPERGF
jgi:integrase